MESEQTNVRFSNTSLFLLAVRDKCANNYTNCLVISKSNDFVIFQNGSENPSYMKLYLLLFIFSISLFSCQRTRTYDTIIRDGLIYDGNGNEPYQADIAIDADTIAFIGDLKNSRSNNEINAEGKAVTPGFINMLSHSEESLIQDGRSQSDLRQGVTLEVLGESSMGR